MTPSFARTDAAPDQFAARDASLLIEEGRVSRRQFRLAIWVALTVALAGVLATPYANMPMLPIPGYMTAFGAAMFVANLLLSALLFSKGSIEQRGDAVRLGTAYFFVAMIFLPMTAAFPNALVEGSLIGTSISSVWIWSFWHAGFGLAIVRYAWFARQSASVPSSSKGSIAFVLLAVGIITLLSTVLIDHLPPVFANGKTFFSGGVIIVPAMVLATNILALISVASLRWRTPEHLWLAVGMVAACFDVWLTVYGADRFALGWYFAKMTSIFTTLVVLISNFHGLTLLYSSIARTNNLLKTLADKDGLTGLANRRRFDEVLKNEWRRAQRDKLPLSILMIDVDHFKKYNDRYGHLPGDECLRQIAAELKLACQRPADMAARYGGEEFVLVLPDTSNRGALEVAQRLLTGVRSRAIAHQDHPGGGIVTISIGCATTSPEEAMSAEALVERADGALYHAKSIGRDRCASYLGGELREAPEPALA